MLRDVSRVIESFGPYPESLVNLTAKEIQQSRDEYFAVAHRFGPRDRHRQLVDTHPMNTHRVGLMHRLFPEAKYVFIVRHPYDVCLSCFFQDFRNRLLAENSRSLQSIAEWYVQMIELWKQYCRVLPLRHHVVRYENLVECFDEEVQSLRRYLDIRWEAEMRDFSARARTLGGVTTASYHQVTEGLNRRGRYRWKNYAKHLAPILPVLRPYAEEFSYDVD